MKTAAFHLCCVSLVLFWAGVLHADSRIALTISPGGDVPAVTIFCTEGHDYTMKLVHEDGGSVNQSPPIVQRLYCPGGVLTFSGFNVNEYLQNRVDTSWWQWVHTPLEYIIKDTTGLGSGITCNADSCPPINLENDSNGFDYSVELASSTYWTAVAMGPIFDTLDHQTWFNIDATTTTGNSSVLFLPGVEASRLYREARADEGRGEKQLWEPTNDADVKMLALDESGKPPVPLLPEYEVYTKDVLDEAYVSEAGPNIYKTFLNSLDTMKSNHTISDYSAVPYDWRLSLQDILDGGTKDSDGHISYRTPAVSQPYIEAELARLASTSQTGKVTIVAHSNGGLITKALMQKLADEHSPLLDKVDKIIFVAVPQVGTPAAIAALLHGYEQSIPASFAPVFLSESTAREFGHNLPSGYNLLPSENYFTYVDTPVVSFDKSLPDWSEKYGDIIHSQERQHAFLTDSYDRVSADSSNVTKPDSLSDTLLAQAEQVHSILDNWTPPAGIKVYEIAGWGIPDTISGVTYKEGRCYSISCGFLSTTIKPYPTWTVDGDGTVVTPSALWMGGGNMERYWINLKSYNASHSDRDHKNILEVEQLDTFIKNVVTNQDLSTLPQYITNSAPIADSGDTRLIYALHSTVPLDVYDDQGNHTGISTSTEKIETNIPNTYHTRFGDSSYVFTPASTTSHIIIDGSRSSVGTSTTFTFEAHEYVGNTLVASTTFQNIPLSQTGTAKVTINGSVSSTSLRNRLQHQLRQLILLKVEIDLNRQRVQPLQILKLEHRH